MRKILRNRYGRWAIAVLLALSMIFGSVSTGGSWAEAASKPAFQKKKLTLAKGKTVKLKVKKMPKGAKIIKTKWKVQKKSVLKVILSGSKAKKKKAKTAKVKALKPGKSAVYCTITYRVKKGGKWKKKSSKAKATITVPAGAKATPMPQKPAKPSETGKPDTNAPAAPGDTAKPEESANPSDTTNPGESTDPGETTDPSSSSNPTGTMNPNGTTGPNGTVNPNGTMNPSGTANPGEATSVPTATPTATPAITPNPDAEVLTWTGTMKRPVWVSEEVTIPGEYSQSSCSNGLTVSNNDGCWAFGLTCRDWSQYRYPVLKCYRLDGDSTKDGLEVWYGSDDASKLTYGFGEWNGQAISLDKAKVSQGIKISNYTPIGKIEICEGEAPSQTEGDVGSHDFSKTALEYSKELKIGWNLGNTLDGVINGGAYVSGSAGLAAETSWLPQGTSKATEALIKAVKEAGFNTIRLPVTWTNHTDLDNDYKIDEVWMNRVEEVVRYCTGNGLHVILNVHHDGADNPKTMKSWLTPEPADEAAKAEMKVRYRKVWEQIATRFKNYSNLVMFSSMNEFHHGYGDPTEANFTLQNELHQIFVDTVRGIGGNNASRYLIVPGYNTNIDHAVNKLKLPTDTIKNHLIVEVHYYDPYTFSTENHSKDQWGTEKGGASTENADNWGQESHVISTLKKMKTSFVDKGTAVVIGEFGAEARKDPANEKYRRYYLQYVVKYATEYGLVPIYWDDGSNYELISRNTYEVTHPDLVNGMMAALAPGYEIPLPK